MAPPYMVITVRVTRADKMMLPKGPSLRQCFALFCLLKERGLILHSPEEWEGTMQWWDPPEELDVTIYRQTIPCKEHSHDVR